MTIQHYTPDESFSFLSKNKNQSILLDVRTLQEHRHEKLIWQPQYHIALQKLAEITEEQSQWLANKHVLIYCKGGVRSQKAIQLLEYLAQSNTLLQNCHWYNLIGGIENCRHSQLWQLSSAL